MAEQKGEGMTTKRAKPQTEPRRRIGRHVALIALIAALGVLGPTGGGVAQAAGAPDGAAAAAECINGRISVRVQGKSITALCGGFYGEGSTYVVYDGRVHYFVVRASDRAVSHIWQLCSTCSSFSNWTSLGGVATTSVNTLTYTSSNGALSLKIWVTGTDNFWWFRDYNHEGSGGWSGWHH